MRSREGGIGSLQDLKAVLESFLSCPSGVGEKERKMSCFRPRNGIWNFGDRRLIEKQVVERKVNDVSDWKQDSNASRSERSG